MEPEDGREYIDRIWRQLLVNAGHALVRSPTMWMMTREFVRSWIDLHRSPVPYWVASANDARDFFRSLREAGVVELREAHTGELEAKPTLWLLEYLMRNG